MSKIGPSKVPGKKVGPNGSFPVGDPTHARLAIPMAERSERAGNISPSQEHHIQAAARAELRKSGGFGDGHTTSGLDAAMQRHADQLHPVKRK